MHWTKSSGLIAALFTPMQPDGSVNLNVIPRYVDHLISCGVKQVYVNGTAGESMSLSIAERKQIAEQWVTRGKGKLEKIIVQCGANNVKEVQELASHAEHIGADCVAVVCGAYFKPTNVDALIAYLAECAKAAPKTPFMYYHIPKMNGVEVSMTEFLKKAHGVIPNLIGIKFTSNDLADATQAHLLFDKKYDIILGGDTIFLGGLAMGLTSAIGVSFSMLGRPFNRMISAFNAGDITSARHEQYKVQEWWNLTVGQGDLQHMIAVLKEVMTLTSGIDMGSPRVPVMKLSRREIDEVKKSLDSFGYTAWIQ